MSSAHSQTPDGPMAGSGNGNGSKAPDEARAEETAWVPVRVRQDSGAAVVLPHPLGPSDAITLRNILDLQSKGRIPQAIRLTEQLQDGLLLGTVLADRYLGRRYRSTTQELADWLARYGDQPDAPAIYSLLVSKLPKGANNPTAPVVPTLVRAAAPDRAPEDIDLRRNDFLGDSLLEKQVLDLAQRDNPSAALRAIGARRSLPAAYAAQMRAEVAQVMFTRNEDADALQTIQGAVRNLADQDKPALAYYVGGLAAWRLGQIDTARTMFEDGAKAALTTPHLQAASAFWASRSARQMHDADGTVRWLRKAAEQPLTLHGFIARRLLRTRTGIMPSGQVLSQADVDAIGATPAGWRAFALLQIGQTDKAEAALRTLWPEAQANPAFGRSLLMVVSTAGLTDCAAQMVDQLQAVNGVERDEFRFPLPKLRPSGGFRIDPSLVYALARLESNFDSSAVSPAGARGLMQIMPATAQYLMGAAPLAASRLHEPATNLDLGQRYVALLSKIDGIDGDLVRMLASYNAGPGAVLRWGAEINDKGDPLLFIEAIPVPETRAFVPTALVYSWVYAARLHLPAPSLDALANGEFPRFTPSKQESRMASIAPVLH